jgi:hypothetical protein
MIDKVMRFVWPGSGFFVYEIGKFAGHRNLTGWAGFGILTLACAVWLSFKQIEEKRGWVKRA